jgi:hypothetical protein
MLTRIVNHKRESRDLEYLTDLIKNLEEPRYLMQYFFNEIGFKLDSMEEKLHKRKHKSIEDLLVSEPLNNSNIFTFTILKREDVVKQYTLVNLDGVYIGYSADPKTNLQIETDLDIEKFFNLILNDIRNVWSESNV